MNERNRIALDGNTPFALDFHAVEDLVAEVTLLNATTCLDQSVGQSRFAMIDMSDNAKVPNMLHG